MKTRVTPLVFLLLLLIFLVIHYVYSVSFSLGVEYQSASWNIPSLPSVFKVNGTLTASTESLFVISREDHVTATPPRYNPPMYHYSREAYCRNGSEVEGLRLNLRQGIVCQPRIIILGVTKCGSTGLRRKLMKNKELTGPNREDIYFQMGIAPQLLGYETGNVTYYWNKISLVEYKKNMGYLSAAPSNFWSSPVYPGLICSDVHCQVNHTSTEKMTAVKAKRAVGSNFENRYNETLHLLMTPLNVRYKAPLAQLIVSFRDPVTRALSHFRHFSKPCTCYVDKKKVKRFYSLDRSLVITLREDDDKKLTGCQNEECFHQHVLANIARLRKCFRTRPGDPFCVRGPLNRESNNQRLLSNGVYSLFLRLWLKVFPLSQLCFTSVELLSPTGYLDELARISKCLGLPNKFRFEEDMPLEVNVRSKKWMMLNKTKLLLQEFYQPFNLELCEILGEAICSRWKWIRY